MFFRCKDKKSCLAVAIVTDLAMGLRVNKTLHHLDLSKSWTKWIYKNFTWLDPRQAILTHPPKSSQKWMVLGIMEGRLIGRNQWTAFETDFPKERQSTTGGCWWRVVYQVKETCKILHYRSKNLLGIQDTTMIPLPTSNL